jgi:hypothetical protein
MAMCAVWAVNTIVSKYVVSVLDGPAAVLRGVPVRDRGACLIPFLRPAPRPIWRLALTAFLMGGGNFGLMFVGLKYRPLRRRRWCCSWHAGDLDPVDDLPGRAGAMARGLGIASPSPGG